MIYLLTAIGLPHGGSSTVHIYTQTIHRTNIKCGRVWAMPRLCELYPGICLTTDEKTQKNLSESWSNCCVQTYKFQSFFKWIKFWYKNFHNLVFILRMNMLFIHNYRLQNSSRKKKDRNLRVWTQHNIKLYLVTYCT